MCKHLQLQVDTRKGKLSHQFTEHFESSVEHLQKELNKHGIPVIPVSTAEPVQDQVRRAIGERAR